ncbi:MAG: hypothetical protein IJS62_05545, partial [Bacteroidales bacterium]|nr:hypothetical protein [Bacteroidales bacterium]
SLLSIAAVLLIACIISVMEYGRMSSYVSDLVAEDISSINTARKLVSLTNAYNLDILAVVGDEHSVALPEFNEEAFMACSDTLRSSLGAQQIASLTDSLLYAYSAYMLTSMELQNVLLSDFIDTRAWYFERLQPRFNLLNDRIEALMAAIYKDLQAHSETFESGFYRSIIPGVVAVGVGILLVLLLLFYALSYYIHPLYKMLSSMEAYTAHDKKYTYTFEGDDQLRQLNDGIRALTDENQELRKRIRALKKISEAQ